MNAFSEFSEITIWHKMRWNIFPLFLFSRPVCIRQELFVFLKNCWNLPVTSPGPMLVFSFLIYFSLLQIFFLS